jgi:hypothetical protein
LFLLSGFLVNIDSDIAVKSPDYAVTALKKLSCVPVCPFSMDFPLFKVGNRTGIAQNAFGSVSSPACPPFFRGFSNTYPVRTLQAISKFMYPQLEFL